jgi:hypothetical protein
LVRDFYCRPFIKRIQTAWKQATVRTDVLLNAALDGGERFSVILRDPASDWTVPRLHDLAKTRISVRDAQLPGARSPWLQNICWCSVLELPS